MSAPSAISKPKPGAWGALGLLLAINLFNYIDRYVLAAVELPMSQDPSLRLNEEQTGLLASAFLYAYMFATPFMGRLAERFSRWYIIGSSVIVWSLASGWTGFGYSFMALLASRIVVGIGEAGYGPAAPALIADYFPIERRGKVMALFYLAMPVGGALGYVIGGTINRHFGWRAAFEFVVIPGLLLGLWCFLRKEPKRVSATSLGQKRSFLADAKQLLRIPSYAFNTAAMTAMTFAIGGISFWIPRFLSQEKALQEGLTTRYTLEQATGAVSAQTKDQMDAMLQDVNLKFGAIVVVAGLISTMLGGWLGDKLRVRWKGAYFGISGIAIMFAFPCTLAMMSLPFPYRWWAVFGAVFFLFFNTGPANTALANVTSSKMRATAFALNIFLIHAFGDAFSPPLVGWVKRHSSWQVAFTLVSLMMVLASVFWLIGARYLAKDEEAALAADAADAAQDVKV